MEMNEGKGPPGPCLAIRGSKGLCLQSPPDYTIHQGFNPDQSKTIKSMTFSPDGSRLAWSNGEVVQIASLGQSDSWGDILVIEHKKAYSVSWSPLGNILATWEMYATQQGKEPSPNLHLWDSKNGSLLKSFFQKKHDNWCPQWSTDERLCSRMVNNEVQFYENGDFQQIKHKIHIQKVSDFGLSPSKDKPHVMTYVPGSKGAPSFAKLYAYPNFEDTQVVASKSFFQADKMEVKWNSSGIYVLLLTQADVDKTGSSYYGKQQLHFLSTKGDSSMVGLSKEGPIYSVEWSPNGSEFCVVYGYMPAKATLFNCKTDPIFDFGTGPRSVGLFNGQGNILMIGGFGNLRGKVEMWDVSDSKNCQSLAQFDATDTTDVKWSPDGQRLMTSTCAPRLRMGNGYKVWHYSGSLLHEKHFATGDELWEVNWQAAPPGRWPKFRASKNAVDGIAPSQPQASKQAYRPPGARGTASTFKLHDDEQLPQNMINLIDQKNKGNTGNAELSKSALKNKKRKEAAKKKRDEEEAGANSHNVEGGNPDKITTNLAANKSTGDHEKDKKIRKVKDKLASIQKLKADQAQGKKLEANQLDKINKEGDLLKELKELKL